MSEQDTIDASDQARAALDRRGFLKAAGAGVGAAGIVLTHPGARRAEAQQWSEKDKLARIASCSYPIRYIFKTRPNRRGGGRAPQLQPLQPRSTDRRAARAAAAAQQAAAAGRGNGGMTTAQMKEKYGEITMLDFPQFTKDTFPGVTHMDIFSGLFGDVTDDRCSAGPAHVRSDRARRGGSGSTSSPTSWWRPAPRCQHISNNAPTNLRSVPDDALRKAGVDDGQAVARGLRGARREVDAHELAAGARPEHPAERDPARSGDGYPRNLDIVPLLDAAIESYKEMADYGGNLGIRVTFENHWGLAADPMNIRIIIDEVNHPVLRGLAGLLQLGARVHARSTASRRWRRTRTPTCTRSTGIAGATRTTCSARRASCSPAASRARSRSSTKQGR